MAAEMMKTAEEEMLTAFSPDLPYLASKAAIELDNLRLGKSSDLVAVGKVSNMLKGSFKQVDGSYTLAIDFGTASIVWSALNTIPSIREKKVVSLEDLIKEALGVSNILDATQQKQSGDQQLEGMRDFFDALSKGAATHLQAMKDPIPPHPFKV